MIEVIEILLFAIWFKHQAKLKDNSHFNKGFVFSLPEQNDILITGINPSDNKKESHHFIYSHANHRYFTKLKKIVPDAAYLDLFNVRGEQKIIHELIRENTDFMVDQLQLTQCLIELVVKPKLVIVFNKGSWLFWGYHATSKDKIWMGYDLEPVKEMKHGNLMLVKGFINHPDRILKTHHSTVLENRHIYFSKYLGRVSNIEIEEIKEELQYAINHTKKISHKL
jgi:hypothetical protein